MFNLNTSRDNNKPLESKNIELHDWFNKICNSIYNRLERIPNIFFNPFVAALILSIIAILYSAVGYKNFGQNNWPHWFVKALEWKIQHPLQIIPQYTSFLSSQENANAGLISHIEKRSFRITIPLFAKVIGISKFGLNGIFILQQITSFFFLVIAFILLKKSLNDSIAAFLGTLAISCSFISSIAFSDCLFSDGIAFFLIILCLFLKNPWLISLLLMFAGLSDERAIAAAPLLFCYWTIVKNPAINCGDFLRLNQQKIGVLTGVFLFFITRYFLGLWMGSMLNLSLIWTSNSFFIQNIKTLPLLPLLLLKGSSIAILIGVIIVYIRGGISSLLALLISSFPIIIVASLVMDVERSFAYVFPLIFFAYKLIGESLPLKTIRQITLSAAIFSLILPNVLTINAATIVIPFMSLFYNLFR